MVDEVGGALVVCGCALSPGPHSTQDPVSPAGSASSYERPIKKERPGTPCSAKLATPAMTVSVH